MSLKVLIISTSLGLGGGDREVVQLVSNLFRRGYEIKIIAMVQLGLMGEELVNQGFDVQSLGMTSGIPDVRVIPRLVSIISNWKPDVIHSHMIHANLLARVTKLFLYKPPVLVCTAQNVDESEGQRWRDFAYRFTDFSCNLTTNVTQSGVERYINIGLVPANKICFIPNSVDSITYSPNMSLRASMRQDLELGSRFTWLAVGRFYLQKDYPTMINAFAKVLSSEPDTVLMIAGEGILQGEIKDLVNQLGIQKSVIFLGPRRDIHALMNSADAQVMSSAWEGMPLVLLEAASTGLPIVSTDVGGVAETVIHGKSGFLVPAASPDHLAKSMLEMMNLPQEKRIEMGQAGRNYVTSNYSTETVVDQWENLYHKILKR